MTVQKTPIKPTCEQIIDILPGPFVIIDRNFNIIAANQPYLDQYQTSAQEVTSKKCHHISHRSDVPCSQNGERCPLEEVFSFKKPVQVMHVHFDQNGEEEYVQLQSAPILDENGEVMYMGEYVQHMNPCAQPDNSLIGRSSGFLRVISLVQRVANSQTTALLLGESGVGKERIAEFLHQSSSRRNKKLVVVDCAALGESLIESELFGYEKGAFTGANSRQIGLIESAQDSTLFIDEIGELPLSLQTKLLRILESGTIRRLGSNDYVDVDVRIIAATNRDLQAMVAAGKFRQDLYYRLSAFPIFIPPLRERLDDIPDLAHHFLQQLTEQDSSPYLSTSVLKKLAEYDYPGNVRELKNIIERAAILACDDPITTHHIVIESNSFSTPTYTVAAPKSLRRRGRLNKAEVLAALEQNDGHRSNTAQQLGVSERTLYRFIKTMH